MNRRGAAKTVYAKFCASKIWGTPNGVSAYTFLSCSPVSSAGAII